MYVQDIRQNVSDIKNNESFQLDGKKCKQKGKKFIFAWKLRGFFASILKTEEQGLQRDIVCLSWPTAPSYMSPNAGWGGEGELQGLSNMSTAVHMEPK